MSNMRNVKTLALTRVIHLKRLYLSFGEGHWSEPEGCKTCQTRWTRSNLSDKSKNSPLTIWGLYLPGKNLHKQYFNIRCCRDSKLEGLDLPIVPLFVQFQMPHQEYHYISIAGCQDRKRVSLSSLGPGSLDFRNSHPNTGWSHDILDWWFCAHY